MLNTEGGNKEKAQIQGKEQGDTKLCLKGNIAQVQLC